MTSYQLSEIPEDLREEYKTACSYENGGVVLCKKLIERIADLTASRAQLVKALEVEHAALDEMCEWHGATHESDCPEDDTCCCLHKAFNDRVNEAFGAGERALESAKAVLA